jgi:DNA-directed RNA polymerase subunit RPC12/RpoP
MSKIETPQAEISRLKRWIDDLQSGMYINCVYCGHRYGPRDKVPTSMADALKLHISECVKHPMHEVLETLKAGSDLIGRALTLSTKALIEQVPRWQAWWEKAKDVIDRAELVKPKTPARGKQA